MAVVILKSVLKVVTIIVVGFTIKVIMVIKAIMVKVTKLVILVIIKRTVNHMFKVVIMDYVACKVIVSYMVVDKIDLS
jgi:hypothetical protein